MADQLTGTKFLVDTGASYSIFPHKSKRPPSGPCLRGPGGQDIACWGEKEMAVFFGGERYTWSFLLAAVQFPIKWGWTFCVPTLSSWIQLLAA
jgi:hypothetical protein